MDYRLPLPDVTPKLNPLERVLIWLSGAEESCLRKCPGWEKRKYEAFGASVLVPTVFGMIGSSYAISTLTDNYTIIVGFAMIWGFIILTIDRVLLATYRAFTTPLKKATQFVLRLVVAVLMGLTVSHPLTLLLFKDTINSEIEKKRTTEMASLREEASAQKKVVEERIVTAAENLAQLQKKYEDTIAGNFVTAEPVNEVETTASSGTADPRFVDIDNQLNDLKAERETVREGLEKWQKTYEEEIGGARGGAPGVGPKARAIEKDHLVWRRDEMTRLNQMISEVTARRVKLSSELMEKEAAANAAIEARKRKLEEQKLDMFTNQQGQLVDVIKGQIESSSKELDRLRAEAAQLAVDTSDRVASVKTERRADMMTQTMVLHHLFEEPENGGHFALMVYAIIASLFTLIDTLPLVVKFFSPAGPYDMVQHIEGAKYTPFHKLNIEADTGDFDQRDKAFRQQMQARIDTFRDVDRYWGTNIPLIPNNGTPENKAEVETLTPKEEAPKPEPAPESKVEEKKPEVKPEPVVEKNPEPAEPSPAPAPKKQAKPVVVKAKPISAKPNPAPQAHRPQPAPAQTAQPKAPQTGERKQVAQNRVVASKPALNRRKKVSPKPATPTVPQQQQRRINGTSKTDSVALSS